MSQMGRIRSTEAETNLLLAVVFGEVVVVQYRGTIIRGEVEAVLAWARLSIIPVLLTFRR